MIPSKSATLRKMFHHPKLFFIFPFKQTGHQFRLCRVRLTASLLLYILVLFLAMKLILLGFHFYLSPTFNFCYKVQVGVMFLILPTNIFWVSTNLSDLNLLSCGIESIDEILCALGSRPTYSLCYFKLYVMLIVYFFSLINNTILVLKTKEWTLVEVLYYGSILYLSIVLAHSIGALLRTIENKFKCLSLNIATFPMLKNKDATRISNITSAFSRLCYVCQKINYLFSPQILILLCTSAINTVVNLFYLIEAFSGRKGSLENDMFAILDSVLWCMNYFLILWFLVDAHTKVTDKVG